LRPDAELAKRREQLEQRAIFRLSPREETPQTIIEQATKSRSPIVDLRMDLGKAIQSGSKVGVYILV
jgi:hypothetical protein